MAFAAPSAASPAGPAAMWAAPQPVSPVSSRSRSNSSAASSVPSAEATLRCDTRTASSYAASNNFTPTEGALDPTVDPSLVLGADPGDGGSAPEEPPTRPGALTAAVLNLLRLQPFAPPGSSAAAAAPGPSESEAAHEAAALTAELHMSARQGQAATRTVLHALSKESLDVLRAERIARRMASEALANTVQVEEASPRVAICAVVDDTDERHSPTKRKIKSHRSGKVDRIYLPIVKETGTARGASGVLRGACMEAPPEQLEVLVE